MEKVCVEMDLHDWEFLPDNCFIDFGHDSRKNLFSRDTKGVVDMNYFICPSKPQHLLLEAAEENSSLASTKKPQIPAPVGPEQIGEGNPGEELMEEIKEIKVVPPSVILANQDVISQVFFKKLRDNEFVDMNMDLPRSGARSINLQIETGLLQFEEKEEAYMGDDLEHKSSESIPEQEEGKDFRSSEIKEKDSMNSEIKEKGWWEGFGIGIGRWRLTGTGALCSMGVAAATVCIFILGANQRQKQQNQNQKPQFQIYTNEKSIKQVMQHATRLNQAISAARGVQMTRANISFGGYFDGL